MQVLIAGKKRIASGIAVDIKRILINPRFPDTGKTIPFAFSGAFASGPQVF